MTESMESFNVVEHNGDIPDGEWSSDDTPFRCEVCGTALEYSGRGRHPKRCDEHRKGGASKGSGGTRSFKNAAQLENAIADMYRTAAFGIGIFDQFDAMAIANSSDKLAKSWITLAESDPKVRKFLEKMVTGTGWGAVIVAHLMVAVPILIHHEKIPTGLMQRMAPKEGQVGNA